MSKSNFDKFINKEVKGAKKKEQFKQEKKQIKKEREAFFIEKKREQRAQKRLMEEQQRKQEYDRKKRPGKENPADGPKKILVSKDRPSKPGTTPGKPAFKKRESTTTGERTPFKKDGASSKSFDRTERKPAVGKTSFSKKEETKNPRKRIEVKDNSARNFDRPERKPAPAKTAFAKNEEAKAPRKRIEVKEDTQESFDRPERKTPTEKPAFTKNEEPKAPRKRIAVKDDAPKSFDRPAKKERAERPAFTDKKSAVKRSEPFERKTLQPDGDTSSKPFAARPAKPAAQADAGIMPLNKYIAHSGVCSRRDAGELVKQGKVTVNGEVVTDPGTKVNEDDKVMLAGKRLHLQHNLVYILLNKPKDYITTAEDPQGRKTVLDIVAGATPERIFPVGRLDRNTSGVLLLTNDGELAQQLTHPSYEVRKIYEAKLDKPLTKADFASLLNGVTLEDGFVQADSVAYADSKDKSIIGIEIHSGRNRVVRRMFEHLGYDVKGLDRVMFANLTKKNVERGRWRFLSEKEVRLLKYFNSSKR